MKHGFLLINKPSGPTSHDCVAKVRYMLKEKKIGHLGTLDPAAEGLLVLAVGSKALKVVELYKDMTKEYQAHVFLGAVSTTYDREGVIEEFNLLPGVEMPIEMDIRNSIKSRFIGKINQIPPAYSAIKVGGERAYRKMRQGRSVDLPPREVEIEACEIESYNYPDLTLNVKCGSGTYIRSLAHDLGHVLRCGGYLKALKRTKVGDWSVEDSVPLEKAGWSNVVPLKEILFDLPKVELTDEQADDLCHGQNIVLGVEEDTIGWHEGLPIAILMPVDGMAHARKVF